jgi:Protein of unknown function (DUF1350)
MTFSSALEYMFLTQSFPNLSQFFAPVFTALAAKNGTFPSSNEALRLSLKMARTATEGKLPTDELLTEISQRLTPKALGAFVPESVVIPAALRQALMTVISPSTQALAGAGVLPLMNGIVDTLDQIPLLIDEVANGARDFIPPPESVKGAARRNYRARRTLILGYDNDPIDESEAIEELLKEAESVTRMKRPMIQIDVQRKTLEGNHATPLLAPPLDIAMRAEDILGGDAAKERLLYAQADATVAELVRWLEEGGV